MVDIPSESSDALPLDTLRNGDDPGSESWTAVSRASPGMPSGVNPSCAGCAGLDSRWVVRERSAAPTMRVNEGPSVRRRKRSVRLVRKVLPGMHPSCGPPIRGAQGRCRKIRISSEETGENDVGSIGSRSWPGRLTVRVTSSPCPIAPERLPNRLPPLAWSPQWPAFGGSRCARAARSSSTSRRPPVQGAPPRTRSRTVANRPQVLRRALALHR